MIKVSTASFIIGIIFIVCAIVLGLMGFRNINGVMCVRHMGGFMSMSYTTTTSMANMCMAMIIAGGFLFVGGILLLMLSALTCPCRCKHHEHKDEEKAEEPAPCCCKKEAAEPEKAEPAEPAEEPAAEPVEEQAPESV